MSNKIITVLILAGCVSLTCANDSFAATTPQKAPTKTALANNQKAYDEDHKNIMVTSKDSKFSISLPSNPTTGYSWFLRDYDAALIEPVHHQFKAPDTKVVGAPGVEIFEFRVKPGAFTVPMQTLIRLTYTRPFQGNDGAKQTVFYVSTMAG